MEKEVTPMRKDTVLTQTLEDTVEREAKSKSIVLELQDGEPVGGVSTIPIDEVTIDYNLHAREAVNDKVVEKFAKLWAKGVEFPPVLVIVGGEGKWLGDGVHRVLGKKAALSRDPDNDELKTIEAIVRPGTRTDAFIEQTRHNRGQSASGKADTRATVIKALAFPDLAKMSNRELGKVIGVSYETIRKVRKEVGSNSTTVIGANGKRYSATAKGKSPKPGTPEASTDKHCQLELAVNQRNQESLDPPSEFDTPTDKHCQLEPAVNQRNQESLDPPSEFDTSDEIFDEAAPETGEDDDYPVYEGKTVADFINASGLKPDNWDTEEPAEEPAGETVDPRRAAIPEEWLDVLEAVIETDSGDIMMELPKWVRPLRLLFDAGFGDKIESILKKMLVKYHIEDES